jgi:hypothetical protein
MRYFYITFGGQMKHISRVRICSASTAVTSGHGIILSQSANVRMKSASASAFGLKPLGTLSWAHICYLTGCFLNDIVISGNCLPGLLEDMAMVMRQNLWLKHDGSPAHYGGNVRQWLNDISRKVDWASRAYEWPPLSPDLILMEFFLWGHVKEHVSSLLRTIEDLMERYQAAVSTIDDMLNRVRVNAVRRSTIVLEMTEAT